LVLRDPQVLKEILGHRGHREKLVLKGFRDLKVPKVYRVTLDLKVRRVP
jgi:hypothetical protein